MRWLVGDLQGCARPFERLLREIRFDPARDELWCLGDLVNRGPDSAAAVRLWRDVGGNAILGNHDVYALLAASGRWPRKKDTLDGLFAAPDRDELLASMRALPLVVGLPAPHAAAPDVWIVHAGMHPAWSDPAVVAARNDAATHDDDWLTSDDVLFATRVRCCTPDGDMSRHNGSADCCPPPYRPWDELYRGERLVVHGHWALRGYYRTDRTLGIDTGCVYGGPLTAWCQDEDRIVQVPGDG